MGFLDRFRSKSPFDALLMHSSKVHECVELVEPIAEALLAGDFDRLEELHDTMSRTEHEADKIKNEIREKIGRHYILSVGKDHLLTYLTKQDNVADAAEDFAVVCVLRKTKIHPALEKEFMEFVHQVVRVSKAMLELAQDINVLVESAFTGTEADKVLKATNEISQMEWHADRLQRRFSKHFYSLESELDPVTIMMYDKYVRTLGQIANRAEASAKILHQMLERHR